VPGANRRPDNRRLVETEMIVNDSDFEPSEISSVIPAARPVVSATAIWESPALAEPANDVTMTCAGCGVGAGVGTGSAPGGGVGGGVGAGVGAGPSVVVGLVVVIVVAFSAVSTNAATLLTCPETANFEPPPVSVEVSESVLEVVSVPVNAILPSPLKPESLSTVVFVAIWAVTASTAPQELSAEVSESALDGVAGSKSECNLTGQYVPASFTLVHKFNWLLDRVTVTDNAVTRLVDFEPNPSLVNSGFC